MRIQRVKKNKERKKSDVHRSGIRDGGRALTEEGGEKAYLLKYSWRVYIGRTTHTRGRRRHSGVYTTYTYRYIQDAAASFSAFFFVVYRAVSGIDASVSSPRAEKRFLSPSLALSLFSFSLTSGASFVFETYEPPIRTRLHTSVGICARAYAYTHVRTIADACVWSRLTCAREPRAWLEKEKNRKSKVPRLVIHRHSAPPVRRHYLRFRGRTNFLIRVGAGGKCTSAARSEQREPSRIPIGENEESDFSSFDRSGETIESSAPFIINGRRL